MQRIRATLTLDADALRVETNSEPRMDRVRAALRESAPDLQMIDEHRRPTDEVREAMGRAPDDGASRVLGPTDPKVSELLQQLTLQHETAGPEQSIPALEGATPREAAADPTRRDDLARLLDSFATGDPVQPGMMNPDRLRAALGL